MEREVNGLVIHAPGDLRVERLPKPEVGAGQLLVRVRCGGICGSDLHYYQHGGFGTVRLQQPMVLGHEVSGVIEAVGEAVRGFSVGQRIAISPSNPCGQCRFCQQGLQNHCLDMRFYGSAMRMPHVQGAFRQWIAIEAHQAHVLRDHVSDAEGALAEPLSVVLHGVRRAGDLLGKTVLVTGCGPIGVLAIMAARAAGAAHIVATDLNDYPLAKAQAMGADETVNVLTQPEMLQRFAADKGQFDVLLEASGSMQALSVAFALVRPRAVIVQLGLSAGEMTVPTNMLVSKELDWRGSFRFHEEFATAVALLNKKQVDVKPLISAHLPYREGVQAFDLAADRSRAMKVVLDFA